jgi:hypothetical protein
MATSSVSPPDPEQDTEDANLPDPSRNALIWASAFLAAAVALALLGDLTNLDKDPPFDPKSVPGGGVAIFAGFLAASVVVERLLELGSPFVPWWDHPGRDLAVATARPAAITADGVVLPEPARAATDAAKQAAIAQKKADRGYAMLTITAFLGVLASAASGLYFADVLGLSLARWADILITGLAIGGGAKAVHEVIMSLQKAKGSGTSAG